MPRNFLHWYTKADCSIEYARAVQMDVQPVAIGDLAVLGQRCQRNDRPARPVVSVFKAKEGRSRSVEGLPKDTALDDIGIDYALIRWQRPTHDAGDHGRTAYLIVDDVRVLLDEDRIAGIAM